MAGTGGEAGRPRYGTGGESVANGTVTGAVGTDMQV